jgi:hypothetical protein
MIILQDSRMPNGSIHNYRVLPSEVGFITEGMALVLASISGEMFVRRPLGTGTDQFVGIAFAPRRELTAPGVLQKEFTIGSTTNIASPNALTFVDPSHNVPAINSIQSINVFAQGTPVLPSGNSEDALPSPGAVTTFTQTASPTTAPTGTGTYQVASFSPLTIVFDAADSGTKVTIVYNYTPTIADVTFNRGWTGQAYGGYSQDFLEQVPVLTQGTHIRTDQFMAGDAWWAATPQTPLYINAAGFFTLNPTGGTSVSNMGAIALHAGPAWARVISPPNFDYPGLCLAINL